MSLARIAAALTLAGSALFTWQSAHGEPSFQRLDDLPGGYGAQAYSISADGSVVMGLSAGEPVLWTADGAVVSLGHLPGASGGYASGVSADGSVVVGVNWYPSGVGEAFRWTPEGGMEGLGYLPGGMFEDDSWAAAISADGQVVVGASTSAAGMEEAFRWTADGGMVGLGHLSSSAYGGAYDASADGSVVVGGSNFEPFRWTAETGMVGLGNLSGTQSGEAYGVSPDGSVVVGRTSYGSTHQAFRWTPEEGLIGLGDLPGGDFDSCARGVSAEGTVVVGSSSTSTLGGDAFIWDDVRGMRVLKDVLTYDYGLDLSEWASLGLAYDISADGRTIVGFSVQGAWIAQIPDPTMLALLTVGAPPVVMTRRRRS